jgi:hypothetical protein
MKQQFVVTHTIHQSETSALTDSWFKNAPVKMLGAQEKVLRKNTTCLNVRLLRIRQFFSVSCKIVFLWVMTNCCFMGDVLLTVCIVS